MQKIPTLDFENRYGYPQACVVGLDEAGRGCLAGPVVAAAVRLPFPLKDVFFQMRDSKALSPKKRVFLLKQLKKELFAAGFAYGVGFASAEEIDALNILQASFLAMKRALKQCVQRMKTPEQMGVCLIDGKHIPSNWKPWKCIPVVRGDQKVLSIACASVIAKVTRDQWMIEKAHACYPNYGFDQHKGYPTHQHLKQLKTFGHCPLYRKSYAPIQKLIAQEKRNKLETEKLF